MELKMTSLRVDAGAGPGSRGGHVIGKTSSGKPIYANAKHPDHKNFSRDEHLEAAAAHGKEADRLMQKLKGMEKEGKGMAPRGGGEPSREFLRTKDLKEHHETQAKKHALTKEGPEERKQKQGAM